MQNIDFQRIDKEFEEKMPSFLTFDKQSGSRWLDEGNLKSFLHSVLAVECHKAYEAGRRDKQTDEIKTMMEASIEAQNSEHMTLTKTNLDRVLNYVERHNKQDEDVLVAEAAAWLSRFVSPSLQSLQE